MHANSMDRILENRGSRPGSASIRVHSRSFAVPHRVREEAASTGTQPAFICHSSKDKLFARKLVKDLSTHCLRIWFDEWSLRPGDSLSERIQSALSERGWLVVVLSKHSIGSSWVTKELGAGWAEELRRRKVFVVPVRIDSCRIPPFLADKLDADFRRNYATGLKQLLKAFCLEPD